MKNYQIRKRGAIISMWLTAIVILFCTQAFAQFVPNNGGKLGLLSKTGEKILENEYDEVKPVYYSDDLYMYKKNNKVGLYDFTAKKMYPCEYDEVYGSVDGIKIRKGNLYGYAVRLYDTTVGSYYYKIVEPQYAMVEFSRQGMCLKKDSLYGFMLSSIGYKLLVPFEMEYPIEYNYDIGYYLEPKSGGLILIQQDSASGHWVRTNLHGRYPYTVRGFLLDYSAGHDSVVFYDRQTLRKMSVYHFEGGSGVQESFSDEIMGMEKVERTSEKVKITWYNPTTGKPFFTREISSNESLRYEVSRHLIFTGEKTVYVEKGRKITFIGKIENYNFVPFAEPIAYKRPKGGLDFGCDPFGCGDFDWMSCLWMGGR